MAAYSTRSSQGSGRLFYVKRGGFRCLKGVKKSKSDKFLQVGELQALLDATKNETTSHASTSYGAFAIAGNLGLRCGEVLAITFEDLAYLRHHYIVVHTLKKRAKQDDRVYLGAGEEALIREIAEGRKKFVRSGLLFPVPSRTMRHYFAYFARKAGIHPNVSFHSLRHTASRMLFNATHDVRHVEERLRHAVKSTLIYLQPEPDEMIAAANKKGVVR